jgi:hypothetical protein
LAVYTNDYNKLNTTPSPIEQLPSNYILSEGRLKGAKPFAVKDG